MFGKWYLSLFLCCVLLLTANKGTVKAVQWSTSSKNDWVHFDVPAILGAEEYIYDSSSAESKLRTILVTLPVTAEIRKDQGVSPTAFRFDVSWNRNAFPLVDYGPRTQTISEVAGTVSVDRFVEKNSNIGLNVNGSFPPFATGSALAGHGGRSGEKVRYDEIPQHDILIASGTIKRGTGAYFRFHPSRAETLEGGREVFLMFQVPKSWRGGVLQVECTAVGSKKNLAWNETVEFKRAFVLPIYLESDEEVLEKAMEFANREQQLRRSWSRYRSQVTSPTSSAPFQGFFTGQKNKSKTNIPDDWVHILIQASDDPLKRYKNQLPHDLANAATEFVESRTSLLKYSR